MAGINLNPYGLNNGGNKQFSNHYSGNNANINSDFINNRKYKSQNVVAYNFRTTNPKDLNLNKKVEKSKDNKNIIIFISVFLLILIAILFVLFL